MTTVRKWCKEHRWGIGALIVGVPISVGVIFLGEFIVKLVSRTFDVNSTYLGLVTGLLVLGILVGFWFLLRRYARKT